MEAIFGAPFLFFIRKKTSTMITATSTATAIRAAMTPPTMAPTDEPVGARQTTLHVMRPVHTTKLQWDYHLYVTKYTAVQHKPAFSAAPTTSGSEQPYGTNLLLQGFCLTLGLLWQLSPGNRVITVLFYRHFQLFPYPARKLTSTSWCNDLNGSGI